MSLGEILKEQIAEMRAMRVLLESMDKKFKAVCEIAEARAISFARRDSQAGGPSRGFFEELIVAKASLEM